MHVPKTAGTSFIAALAQSLHREVIGGFDRVLFGDFTEWESLDMSVRCQIIDSPAALPPEKVVAGHFSYATVRHRRSAQLITVMREPVSRLLSHWLYWRSQNDESLARWGAWALKVLQSRRPLADFLREPSLAAQMDNLTTRMLLWPHPLIASDRFIDRRHGVMLLSEARRRLGDFAFLGILADPGLENRLQAWLGQPFAMSRINVTSRMPEGRRGSLAEQLTSATLDLLEERSWLDAELWRDVVRETLPDIDVERLRAKTLMQSVARFSALLAG
jgi:hypothetical protein